MRTLALLIVSAALLWSAMLSADQRTTLDEILYRPDGTAIGIPVQAAVAEDGRLRADLLGRHFEAVRQNMEMNRTRAASSAVADCHIFLGSIPDHFSPNASMRDLSTHAHLVVSGTVRAMREGFYSGLPGTLVSLDARTLKGEAPGEVLFFYPLARIETANGLVCAKPAADFEPPRIGDRFLVFAMVPPVVIDGRTFLDVNVARELLHERPRGRVLIPKTLRSEVVSIDAAERRVQSEIERHHKAR